MAAATCSHFECESCMQKRKMEYANELFKLAERAVKMYAEATASDGADFNLALRATLDTLEERLIKTDADV